MTITTLFRDKLPKGLCFPLGLEILSACAPDLAALNAGVVFVWQSTWASQIFDAQKGDAGRLAVCQVRQTIPHMRINALKVRNLPEDAEVVVAEFAIASSHRSKVLDAFKVQGAGLLSVAIRQNPRSSFFLVYDIEKGLFAAGKPEWPIW